MQPALVSGEPQSNSTEESPISSREASGTRMGACLLRGGQYFLWIGLAALGIADHAVRPDQVDGALHEETARMIERYHFLPSIHQQRKRKVVFRLKLGVTSGARRIDSEHLRVALAGLDPLVAELAQLLPANRCVVAGVEYQDHVLAAHFGETHVPPSCLGSVKSGAWEPVGSGSEKSQSSISLLQRGRGQKPSHTYAKNLRMVVNPTSSYSLMASRFDAVTVRLVLRQPASRSKAIDCRNSS